MSRYRKIITGEVELPEISGTKFLIYPTVETRMELLEHIKSTQVVEEIDEENEKGEKITRRIKGKYLSLSDIARSIAGMCYEGCFEHDVNGKRGKKKEGEEETTEKQLLGLVLQSDIMSVYLEILKELDIISKEKAEELVKGQGEAEKKL